MPRMNHHAPSPPSPSSITTQDSLFSWTRPVRKAHGMSRPYSQYTSTSSEAYRPSSSRSGRIPSAETATSLWSEDGAETVLPTDKGDWKSLGGSGQVYEEGYAETIADTEGDGDLIQLYSDGERKRRSEIGRGTRGSRRVDESLLDSQPEFLGLQEGDPSADRIHGRVVHSGDEEEDEDDPPSDHDPQTARPSAAAGPTPGDKLRQLLAQMQAQSALHSHTAQNRGRASPQKRITPLPTTGVTGQGEGPSSLIAADSTTRVKDAWRRTSGQSSLHSDGFERNGEAGPSSPPLNVRKANWREGRRIGVYPPQSPPRATGRRSAGRGGKGDGASEGDEEDSPPTPPMRISNPFAASARRREQSAAAGHSDEQRSSSPQHLKNALEQYISHHPTVPPPPPADPSSSRSFNTSASSSSRKGKERAHPTPPHQSDPSTHASHLLENRHYVARTPAPATARHTNSSYSRRPLPAPTPRRSSVDLAPDDSALFAQEVEGLEIQGTGTMLDLDEDVSGRGVMWDEGSSEADADADADGEEDGVGEGSYGLRGGGHVQESGGRSFGRGTALGSDKGGHPDGVYGSHVSQGNRTGRADDTRRSDEERPESSFERGNRSRESSGRDDSGRLRRLLGRSQQELPNEADSDSAEALRTSRNNGPNGSNGSDRMEDNTACVPNTDPASRYHSAEPSFRASTSIARPAQSSFTRDSIPIRVGLASIPDHIHSQSPLASSSCPQPADGRTATPGRASLETPAKGRSSINPNYSNMATPHPPGWLGSTPVPARAVRFSPLRRGDADWSASVSSVQSVRTAVPTEILPGHGTGSEAQLSGARTAVARGEEDGLEEGSSIHRIKLRPSPKSRRTACHPSSPNASIDVSHSPSRSSSRQHKSTSSPFRSTPHTKSPLAKSNPNDLNDPNDTFDIDPDSSFSTRLLAPLARLLPSPSRTYVSATPLIVAAEEETLKARAKVEESQRLWMEAIGALQRLETAAKGVMGRMGRVGDRVDGEMVKGVVKGGWKWGRWGWWVFWEVVLMWAVFRITIEYASPSLSHLSHLYPFTFYPSSSSSPSSRSGTGTGYGLAIPLPHGLSAFVVRQSRTSINFFDLLEKADFWLMGVAASRMEGVSRGWEAGGGPGGPGGRGSGGGWPS